MSNFQRPYKDGDIDSYLSQTCTVDELPQRLHEWIEEQLKVVAEAMARGQFITPNSLLNSMHRKMGVAHIAQQVDKLAATLVPMLKEKGIRRVGLDWKFGAFSVVIPFGKTRQLLRISTVEDEVRFDEMRPPLMLKPQAKWEKDGIRVEVYPEVSTEGVTDGHVAALATLAPLFDCYFWDARKQNVGLYKGVPVILDPGSVIPFSKANEILCKPGRDVEEAIRQATRHFKSKIPMGSARSLAIAAYRYGDTAGQGVLVPDAIQSMLQPHKLQGGRMECEDPGVNWIFDRLGIGCVEHDSIEKVRDYVHKVLIPMGLNIDEDYQEEARVKRYQHAKKQLAETTKLVTRYYRDIQHELHNGRHLKDGVIQGAFDQASLENLYRQMRGLPDDAPVTAEDMQQSVIATAVTDLGLDKCGLKKLSAAAAQEFLDDKDENPASWRMRMKERIEKAKRNAESKLD